MFAEVHYTVTTAVGWRAGENPAVILESPGRLPGDQVVFDAGHDLLAILFENLHYLGGAHPGSYHRTLNYDFTTGQQLALSDLFVPGAAYLERIAEFCLNELRRKLDPDIWESGASPTPENYQVWALTSEGLLIIFESYQVAPYAAGPQFVIVPYDLLADILQPQGPLGSFAAGGS
jgi:hypothetical protein